MTNPEQIIWAAGFFDGEGCVLIMRLEQRGRATYLLRLTVGQVDRAPLELFRSMFGGTIRSRKRDKYADAHEWVITSDAAANALRLMLPYLVLKKKQAKVGLSFQKRRFGLRKGKNNGSDKLIDKDQQDFERIRELKVHV